MAHHCRVRARDHPSFGWVRRHVLDPMAELELVEDDYAWLTDNVMRLAEVHAGRRVVSVLEGGYHRGATARSVVAHLKAML